jgi:hypothetical protein
MKVRVIEQPKRIVFKLRFNDCGELPDADTQTAVAY